MTSIDEYTETNYLYYLQDIKDYPVLSREQEYSLMERIRSGDKQAYDYFYSCNLKWALKIAKQYQGRGCALMDLIQAGNEGLMKAVEKFNHRAGYKFSTYATAWIHQAIGRLLRQKGLVWIPEYIVMEIRRMHRAEGQLGDNASDEQIATLAKLPVERLQELRQWGMETVSFEAIVNDDNSPDPLSLETSLIDHRMDNQFEQAEQADLREAVAWALDKLSTRERAIVRMRFGFDDEGGKTLQATSNHYGVSRQRIDQIQTRALEKLEMSLHEVAQRWIGGVA